MPPSDETKAPRAVDWRGWFALAWVVWFGLQYGATVVAARGGKLRAAVATLAPEKATRPANQARP